MVVDSCAEARANGWKTKSVRMKREIVFRFDDIELLYCEKFRNSHYLPLMLP